MTRATEARMLADLESQIDNWWQEHSIEYDDVPYIGENTFGIMAEAALAVLRGAWESELYMKQEELLK